jgi:hypothetical protein
MQKAGKSVNNTIHHETIFGGGFRAWEKTVAVSNVNFNRQIRNNLFLTITEVETDCSYKNSCSNEFLRHTTYSLLEYAWTRKIKFSFLRAQDQAGQFA